MAELVLEEKLLSRVKSKPIVALQNTMLQAIRGQCCHLLNDNRSTKAGSYHFQAASG